MSYRTDMLPFAAGFQPIIRFAIGYAPVQSRDLFLALFLLDREMEGIIRRQREPMIAQIRLAWWRERLGAGQIPLGHPLNFISQAWDGSLGDLIPMIDGWEELLPQERDVLAAAQGRSAPFGALARRMGCEARQVQQATVSAMRWALVDLADHLSDQGERDAALGEATVLPNIRTPLPRALRPLAVLDGLAMRVLRRGGGGALLGDRLSPLAALRLGIFGR